MSVSLSVSFMFVSTGRQDAEMADVDSIETCSFGGEEPPDDVVERAIDLDIAQHMAQQADMYQDSEDPGRHVSLSVSERLHRLTKYGRCPIRGEARRPVCHFSGQRSGFVLLRCRFWWSQAAGRRDCWHGEKFCGDYSSLPRGVQEDVRQVRSSVSWQLQHAGTQR